MLSIFRVLSSSPVSFDSAGEVRAFQAQLGAFTPASDFFDPCVS